MKQRVNFKQRLESTNPCIEEYKDVLLSASIMILEASNNFSPEKLNLIAVTLTDYHKLLNECLSIIKEESNDND